MRSTAFNLRRPVLLWDYPTWHNYTLVETETVKAPTRPPQFTLPTESERWCIDNDVMLVLHACEKPIVLVKGASDEALDDLLGSVGEGGAR